MALSNIYFCTPALVKENSLIDNNVQDSIIKPVMLRVQTLYFENILGTPLFNKILALKKAGTIGGTDYETLMDTYILPCYFAYVEYEAMPHVNVEIRNKAVGKGTDTDIRAASEQEMNYTRANSLKVAKRLEKRLIGHLRDEDSSDTYPEYDDYDCSKEEQVKPKSNIYGRTSFINGL